MKRFLCWLFAALLLVPSALGEAGYAALSLRPGDSIACPIAASDAWTSDAPEVATVTNSGVITAYNEGFATVSALDANGDTIQCDVTVTEDAMPALIRSALDIALTEWEQNLGNTFTQNNKYTKWYCGVPCKFGWCGGFVTYCLAMAGVPMFDGYEDCVPVSGGAPYSVREAGVGKILTGFTKMERMTRVPKPGYLVVYGERGRNGLMHIAMITDVSEYADGVYMLKTVEGNLSSRIKRYCYLYDMNADPERNMKTLPESEQTDSAFQYKLHQDNWYVNQFCMTW